MRIAEVIGTVTLSRLSSELARERRLKLAVPLSLADLTGRREAASRTAGRVRRAGRRHRRPDRHERRRRGRAAVSSRSQTGRRLQRRDPGSTFELERSKATLSSTLLRPAELSVDTSSATKRPDDDDKGTETMVNAHKIKQDICEIGRRIYSQGLRRRQRRQHHGPHQRERGALHADDALQGLPEARGHLHRRHEGQAARRPQEADQRSAAAPGDLRSSGPT